MTPDEAAKYCAGCGGKGWRMYPTNSGAVQLACGCALGKQWFEKWLEDRAARVAALPDEEARSVEQKMADFDEGVRAAADAACSAPPSTRMSPALLRRHILAETGVAS